MRIHRPDAGNSRLAVIGGGKVGRTLARLWSEFGVFVIGDVLTRSLQSARDAAGFIGSGRPVAAWADLEAADVYMLAVPDDAIEAAARRLVEQRLVGPGCIVFHCSGSKASAVLHGLKHAGAQIASLHPVKSFADPGLAVETFAGTHCALEGDERAVTVLRAALERCEGRCFDVIAERKLVYHAATVFASNYLVALLEVALQCFERAGISRAQGLQIALPLLHGTIDNVARLGTVDALTGPIARGDSGLVSEQLQALLDWERDVGTLYARLGRSTMGLAQQRRVADAAALEHIAAEFSRIIHAAGPAAGDEAASLPVQARPPREYNGVQPTVPGGAQMIRLQLNDGEARLLQEILESTLADLSYEIADTDVKSYRDDLKARREVLRQLTAGLVEELEGGRTVD